MKVYKLFDRSTCGALCSYNPVNKSTFNAFLLKYEQGEWREPEIRGTALFCLNKIPDNIDEIINADETVEIWEVEAEGEIGRDAIIFQSCWNMDMDKLAQAAEEAKRGEYSNKKYIDELFELFPDAVCFERVKPIQRVR